MWSSDSVEGSEGLKLAIQARDDCLAKPSRFRIKKAHHRMGRRAKASIPRFVQEEHWASGQPPGWRQKQSTLLCGIVSGVG